MRNKVVLIHPIIANVFYKAGLIENGGRGTTNIIKDCLAYGLPKPTSEYEWTAVRVTFYKAKQSERINEGIKSILEFIQSNLGQRVSQISQSTGIPAKTLERWIKQLKEQNKIEFRGSKKTGGYWEVSQ